MSSNSLNVNGILYIKYQDVIEDFIGTIASIHDRVIDYEKELTNLSEQIQKMQLDNLYIPSLDDIINSLDVLMQDMSLVE